MNREIKFRALYKPENKIFPCSGPWMGNVVLLFEPGVFKAIAEDNVVVMQFTGLKDKNGKEIYEGDIVQWTKIEPVERKHDLLLTASVSFSKGGFVPFTDSAYNVSPEETEIIGSIYENPELLKNEPTGL